MTHGKQVNLFNVFNYVMNKGKQNLIETYTNTRRTMYVNKKKDSSFVYKHKNFKPCIFLVTRYLTFNLRKH